MPARYTCSCRSEVSPERSWDAPLLVCSLVMVLMAWSPAAVVVGWAPPDALLVLVVPHAAAASPTTSTTPASLRYLRFNNRTPCGVGFVRSTGQLDDRDDRNVTKLRRRPPCRDGGCRSSGTSRPS